MSGRSRFQVVAARGFAGPRRASPLAALEAWERRMLLRGFQSAQEIYRVWKEADCRLVMIKPDGTVDRIV